MLGVHRLDPQLAWAFGGILGLLALATIVGLVLRVAVKAPSAQKTIDNLNQRIRRVVGPVRYFLGSRSSSGRPAQFSCCLDWSRFSPCASTGHAGVPTRRADHHTLFWTFFVFTPLQYYLLGIKWTGFFIVIPVYAFLFLPAVMALAGDTRDFLERAAKIQWGLMICVYCISYAPALLTLDIHGYGPDAKTLCLFFVIVDQLSDVLQYVWGKPQRWTPPRSRCL